MTAPPVLGPSLLFCPGDRPDRFVKAVAVADTAVLDLEDGVSAERKDFAREAVVSFVRQAESKPMVRINHPETARGMEDAAAVLDAGGRILLLAKTESRLEIEKISGLQSGLDLALVPTIESPRGALAMDEILSTPEVAAIGWGPYDLAAAMGLERVRNDNGSLASPLAQIRDRMVLVAAAYGKSVFDTVTTEFGSDELLRADVRMAVSLGMIGKFAIHPRQVAIIQTGFMPSAEKLDYFRRLVAADTGGAFGFEGQMVDAPIIKRAQRYLSLAERYSDALQHGA